MAMGRKLNPVEHIIMVIGPKFNPLEKNVVMVIGPKVNPPKKKLSKSYIKNLIFLKEIIMIISPKVNPLKKIIMAMVRN